MTPPDLEQAVAVIRERLPQTSALYLYGSFARGDARVDSDVDVAVFTNGAPVAALDMWNTQMDLVGHMGRPVDLVHLDRVSTVLQREVMVDGRRLYAADTCAADLFEVRVLRDYADLMTRRADIDADIVARGRVFA